MRTILLKLLFLFAATTSLLLSQTGPFTVRLRLSAVDTTSYPDPQHPSEWLMTVYVDIFDVNNNLVPPSSNYRYDWYHYFCNGNYPESPTVSQYGLSSKEWDGNLDNSQGGQDCCSTCIFQAYNLWVSVTISGEEYFSPTIRIPDESSGTKAKRGITLDQKRENNSTAGNFERYFASTWHGYPAPQTFYRPTTITSEVYRGYQGFVSGTNDRYNRWSGPSGDISDIVNHKSLQLTSNQQTYTSRLQTAHNATIQICPAVGGPVAGTVFFKDPWLIDDNTDPLGARNRGSNAVFVSKSTPFYPFNDSNTKGVFLNQDPQQGKPAYTIKTYQTLEAVRVIWDFGYWSGTNATFGNANNLETSVVFTNSNAVVTANYDSVIKPVWPDNIVAGGSVGNPVHITWTEHPHPGVTQYKIWRRVKPLGQQEGPPELIGTVNRGTTQFYDYEYQVTSTYTDYNLTYDVRSYFAANGTYSDQNWSATQFGEIGAKIVNGPQSEGQKVGEIPADFSVSSYPNPFNPSTTLLYNLAEDAEVSLAVYDMMGREVAMLVHGEKSAGYHSVQWNGKDGSNSPVATGTYIYRLVATPFSNKQPIVLSGKLLLTK